MKERRSYPRREVGMSATAICSATGQPHMCAILDISHSGAKFAFAHAENTPDEFTIVMPGGFLRCCTVVRRTGPVVSARFIDSGIRPQLVETA